MSFGRLCIGHLDLLSRALKAVAETENCAGGESSEGLWHWGRRASVSAASRFCWLNSSRLPQSAGLDPSAAANGHALARHRPSCRLGLRAKMVGGLPFHVKGWRPYSCDHVSKRRNHS